MFEEIKKQFGGIGKDASKATSPADVKAGNPSSDDVYQTSDAALQPVRFPVFSGGRLLSVDPTNYSINPLAITAQLIQNSISAPAKVRYAPVVIEFDANGYSNLSVTNTADAVVRLRDILLNTFRFPIFGIIVIAERKDTQLGTAQVGILSSMNLEKSDYTVEHSFQVTDDQFKAHVMVSAPEENVSLTFVPSEVKIVGSEAVTYSQNFNAVPNTDSRILQGFAQDQNYGLSGQNVTVTVYPVPYDRALALQIEDAINSDSLEELSARLISQY